MSICWCIFLCKRFCVCLSSVSTVTRTSWDSYKLFGFNFWLVTRVGWAVTLWTKTICFSIPFGIFLFLLFVCLVAKTTKTRACFYQNLRILSFAKRPFVGLWIYQMGVGTKSNCSFRGLKKSPQKSQLWKFWLHENISWRQEQKVVWSDHSSGASELQKCASFFLWKCW